VCGVGFGANKDKVRKKKLAEIGVIRQGENEQE
jgi:hypothetical protein